MASIVIEIPNKLKALEPAIRQVIELAEKVSRPKATGRHVDYGETEVEAAAASAGVEIALHKIALSALDIDAPFIRIRGRLYRRFGRTEGRYYSQAGPVPLQRTTYRPVKERNGRLVDPVSLRAGVVGDGWLPRTAAAMAHQLQRGTSREAEEGSKQMGRLPYSRCSFERVGHAVAVQYKKHRERIEDALIELYEVPDEAESVSVSIDRVSIPMEEPREPRKGRPGKRVVKRPVQVVYHMGYCATVTLHDEQGEALHTIRYGRMPATDTFFLGDTLACDVAAILRKRPDLRVVLLADGAKEIWGLLDEHVSSTELDLPKRQVTRLIDLWHVLEKLGKAAQVAYGDDMAKGIVHGWRMRLLNRSSAVAMIAEQLRSTGCDGKTVKGERPVHEAITYLENNGDRMNYASARRKGLPLGSGNVEATCKSLVAQRMKRSGARWKEKTGDNILQLRALALSDRWDPAMRLTLKPLRRSVTPLQAVA